MKNQVSNKQWRLQRLFCISDLDVNNRRIWLHSEAPMEVHILLKSMANGKNAERSVGSLTAYSFSKAYNVEELSSALLGFEMIQRVDNERTVNLLQAA